MLIIRQLQTIEIDLYSCVSKILCIYKDDFIICLSIISNGSDQDQNQNQNSDSGERETNKLNFEPSNV